MVELGSYGLLTVSTILFGFMFFFNDMFGKNYGSGLKATLVMSFGGGIFGFLALAAINGLKFEFTIFAFIMAIIATVNGLLFSFCSLKALGKINLSLYSLFSMLGGMALPFVTGILFYGESLTVGKLVCFVIITVALCLTVKKEKGNSGAIYYAGVFFFNGMSGVIAQAYQDLPFEKISSAEYAMLCAIVAITLSGIPLLFLRGGKKKINLPCVISMAGCGILEKVANWLLLVALVNLPASAQYPFVTGGTIIVSTIISFFSKNKPSRKEIAAVILAFIGVLLLVLLPGDALFAFAQG